MNSREVNSPFGIGPMARVINTQLTIRFKRHVVWGREWAAGKQLAMENAVTSFFLVVLIILKKAPHATPTPSGYGG